MSKALIDTGVMLAKLPVDQEKISVLIMLCNTNPLVAFEDVSYLSSLRLALKTVVLTIDQSPVWLAKLAQIPGVYV